MIFTEEHELEVLRACAADIRYMGKAAGLLERHLFLSRANGWIFSTMAVQYRDFGEIPTKPFVEAKGDDVKDAALRVEYLDAAGRIFGVAPQSPNSSLEFLEEFVRFRTTQTAITEALDHLEKDRVGKAQKALARVLIDGRSKKSTELDWMGEFEKRIEARKNALRTGTSLIVATQIKSLDAVIGGIRAGELGLIVGDTGKGKSIFLTHLGFMAAVLGWKVVHFSLEMPAEQVATRYDSRLLKIPHRKLKDYNLNAVEERFIQATIDRRRAELAERLYIVSFPVRAATILDIREVLRRRAAEGHKPDLVLVDSGDHMNPVKSLQSFRLDTAAVYWDLKALSTDPEFACGVWSTTQAKQEIREALAGTKAVSESYDKPRIADIVLTLNQTEEQAELIPPELDAWLAKHRDGEAKKKITLTAAFNIMMYREKREVEIID